MDTLNLNQPTSRRKFLGNLAIGAATAGVGSLFNPFQAQAGITIDEAMINDADTWFNQIKGKHKIVFDVTEPNGVFPFAWPKIFLLTNEKTGTPAKECNAVVVLRHEAIPYAMKDDLWLKYKFGEVFHADDPKTNAASVRNPFWQPKEGDFQVPGIGNVNIGINELQASGVMFCVCDMALTVYSAVVAQKMNMAPADVKKEWVAGVLPGIQIVPSGVWAVGRAQERGCGYCFAG
ncbi:twin-arginine translocation signal domain-containing protein [Solitalea lacus]|uniref:twin-arginine translocation signal domain-containing protein n=1 Tax=Solitalea lacus TaxID=2911172 RepID=UPI001EDAEBA3|nr:twin-arginine translocation signal domain-containing protein [Solitalea lacus]UKJ08886.1 twin-arginine translocation signal domain-containing protein [Solitalea lacus]